MLHRYVVVSVTPIHLCCTLHLREYVLCEGTVCTSVLPWQKVPVTPRRVGSGLANKAKDGLQ